LNWRILSIFSQCHISLVDIMVEPLEECKPKPAYPIIPVKSGRCKWSEMLFDQSSKLSSELFRVSIFFLKFLDDVAFAISSSVYASEDRSSRSRLGWYGDWSFSLFFSSRLEYWEQGMALLLEAWWEEIVFEGPVQSSLWASRGLDQDRDRSSQI